MTILLVHLTFWYGEKIGYHITEMSIDEFGHRW